MSRFAALLLICTVSSWLNSEVPERLVFDRLPVGQELNQNTVQAVHEDVYGLLWIGTQSGLHVFDGHELSLFQNDANQTNGLLDSFVLDIASSPEGELWVATLLGISRLERKTMRFKALLKYPFKLANDRFSSIAYDEQSRKLYFASRHQLYAYNLKDSSISLVDEGTNLLLVDDKLKLSGNVLLLKNNQELVDLTQYKKLKFPQHIKEKAKYLGLFDQQLYAQLGKAIFVTSDGLEWHYLVNLPDEDVRIRDMSLTEGQTLWIATQAHGLFAADLKNHTLSHFNQENTNLPLTDTRTLWNSRDRILWLGTSSRGIFAYELTGQRFEQVLLGNKEKTGYMVRAIGGDGSVIVAGTEKGFFVLQENLKEHVYFPADFTVFDVSTFEDGFLLATSKGLFRFNPKNNSTSRIDLPGFHQASIRTVVHWDSLIILGSDQNGVLVMDPTELRLVKQISVNDDQSSAMVLKLLVDSEGRLWVGSIDGLYVINDLNNYLFQTHSRKPTKVLSDQIIRDIFESSKGHFFIGSHSGLIELKESSGEIFDITVFTKKDGLSDNTIYSILPVNDRKLWLSSNKGLTLFDWVFKQAVNYQDIHHLGQLEFNGASKYLDRNGKWMFGGINGITAINSIASPKVADGPIWIYSIRYGENFSNQHYFPQEQITFNDSENVISIKFINTNFDSSQKAKFRYRLNEGGWIDLGQKNEVVFSGLKPDAYQLEIQSKLGLSDWRKGKNTLSFHVVTEFWRSERAKLIYAILFVLFVSILAIQEFRRRRENRRAMERIQTNEERLMMALTASELGLWDYNFATDEIKRFNISHLFNIDASDIEFEKFDHIVHPKDLPGLRKERQRFFIEKGEFEAQYRVMDKQGGWRWIHDKGKVVELDEEGDIVRASGTYSDITEIKRAQLESVLSNEVIRSMAEAVVVLDSDRKVAFVNPAFCRMTGYRFEQIIHNKLIYLRSNRHAESFYDKFWEEFDRDGIWFGELWVRCESGKEILCSLEAFHISDDELEEYLRVLIFNNITEKRRAEEELSFLARYDALTGLPNRNLFNDRLEHAIALAKRHNHQVAVMFIDLDGFKKVNDSFGHHAGDVLLKQTADIIRSCLRDEDTLARLSGDEFIVIIEDYQSDAQLKVVLNKIMAKLQQPMDIVQNKVVISCSIGVSQFPLDGSSAEELMKFADTAMYHAKEQGKNQYYFYQKEMHQKLIHRLNIENYLRDAVAKDELYLVFQPIVDVVSHKIVSAEALIRWNNPSLGEVYPMDFIPLAEESGYILEVGRYVLKKACYYIAKWQEDYGNKVKIAVNVSVRQLMDSDFVNDLANIIKESGVNADSLKVEVTESMLMANAGKANQILRDLKNLGVTVSIDDFGTGYSSLSYLKRFAIDELKIDKEFISDITEEGEEETIVNAIIALAKSLSLKVVAEGVETKIQLDYLASHHCDYAQGYLFSKPCKPEELELFLAGKKTFDKTIG